MDKYIADSVVLETGRLSPDVFSLWLQAPDIVSKARAGQFVSLYPHDGGHILPRPISICETDTANGRLRLVYRVVGFGTAEFSMMIPGNKVRMMGPLGNGYPIEEDIDAGRKNFILIGGGIGIPPMLSVAKSIKEISPGSQITAVMGYRDRHNFLSDNFYELADELLIATDDGSRGIHGTVIDAMKQKGVTGDIVYSCGPTPMLRGVKDWAVKSGIPARISLEERMACGIGACLGCVCDTVNEDSHSKVTNARVCKDGPVFNAEDVKL